MGRSASSREDRPELKHLLSGAVLVTIPEFAWAPLSWLRRPIHNEEYNHDYRQMGTWRLSFQFEFAKRMGHDVRTFGKNSIRKIITRPRSGRVN